MTGAAGAGGGFPPRMSDQDALLWFVERDPLLRSTITAVSIMDRPPDRKRLTARVEEALGTFPRLCQRVVETPWNVAPPAYVVDEYLDLRYHLRFVKAPGEGSLRDLLDLAAPLAMAGFDRSRPLWEFYVVEGFEGERAALIEKMHHAIADGVSAVKLSMALLDTRRDPHPPIEPLPAPPEPEHPSFAERLGAGLATRAREQMTAGRAVSATLAGSLRHPVRGTSELARTLGSTARLLRPVTDPLSPLMRGRSTNIRFDTLSASLPAMKAAAKRVGGRLNVAFVAAVAGGLHRYHQEHGAPVDLLRMTMPINTRPRGDEMLGGNQFVPARFPIPVAIADPLQRMRRLGELLSAERAEPGLGMAGPVAAALNRLPVAVSTRLFGSMLKAVDVVTSNVPGAPIPLYLAGARLESNFGFGPMAGAACNVTLLSYLDHLNLAVSTDPAAVPDPEVFVDCLRQGVDEIEALGSS